jgi:hypothetical protein
MKTIELQLVMVGLEDGEQGVFVGIPLVSDSAPEDSGVVKNIWFSNTQEVPESLTLEQLMELVNGQMGNGMATIQ